MVRDAPGYVRATIAMIDALQNMLRDVDELPFAAPLMALPTLVGIPVFWQAARRALVAERDHVDQPGLAPVVLALVAPVILISQIALWYAYYATDLFSNPGLACAMAFAILPLFVSWATTAAAIVTVRQQTARSASSLNLAH